MNLPDSRKRYTISKTFSFDSAHFLVDMPEGHPCANLHGHTYTVTVTLVSSVLDEHGMVFDFNHFRDLKAMLDHKCLNDVLDDNRAGPTTSENLCAFIMSWTNTMIDKLYDPMDVFVKRVRVAETGSSYSELEVLG